MEFAPATTIHAMKTASTLVVHAAAVTFPAVSIVMGTRDNLRLCGSEARTLATVGAFRVVSSRDLRDDHDRPSRTKKKARKYGLKIGRDGGIRTHDPLTPSQVRYQAALHPEIEDPDSTAVFCSLPARVLRFLAKIVAELSQNHRPHCPRAFPGSFAVRFSFCSDSRFVCSCICSRSASTVRSVSGTSATPFGILESGIHTTLFSRSTWSFFIGVSSL